MAEGICDFRLRLQLTVVLCSCWITLPAAGAARDSNTDSSYRPANMSNTYRAGDRLELHTDYVRQPSAEGDGRGFLSLHVQSRADRYIPSLQAELDYGAFDPNSNVALDSEQQRAVLVAAQSAWSGVQYGARYQSIGQNFVPLAHVDATTAPGTDRSDVWAQRQFGKAGLRTFASQVRGRAIGEPDYKQWARAAVGATLDYALASAPAVDAAVTYSHQTMDSFNDARDAAAIRELNRRLSATFSIRQTLWNASASSSYTYQPDCTEIEGLQTDIWRDSIAVAYTPAPDISLSPTLTYEDAPATDRSHTKTRSAAIKLQYRPVGRSFLVSASSSIAAQRNASWDADAIHFSSQAGICMPLALNALHEEEGALALQLKYIDASDTFSSNNDVLLNLQLSLHNFD